MFRFRYAAGVLLVASAVLVAPMNPATASPTMPSLEDAVAEALLEELNAMAAQSGGAVRFENVQVDLAPELLIAAQTSDPLELAEFVLEEADRQSESVPSALRPAASAPVAVSRSAVSTSATRRTQFYTADQSTVLPAFGVAWVNQDMNVTYTGNTINSVSLRGNSYGTGISLFAYTHVNTSLQYRLNRTCLYTSMRGTFSAIVKGSAVSFVATVLATDAPRGGRMVSLLYTQC